MHQVKAHFKRNPNIWQEHEEQINPIPKHGINQHNGGGYMSHPQIDKGNSRQYQIQRLKRDAPDIATKVINREISAKHGSKRKNPPLVDACVCSEWY